MAPLPNFSAAEWILNSALQCTLFLLVGRLFLFLFRRRGAPLRSAICLVTMLVLIALPFLSLSTGGGGFLPFHASLPVTIGTSVGSIDTAIEFAAEIPQGISPQESLAGVSFLDHPFLAAIFSGPTLIRVINLLGLIWGMGCALLGLRFAYGLLVVHDMRRGSTPAGDPRIPGILASAEAAFGRHIRTKILVSPHIDSPMAVGFFRPIVLLPEGLLVGLSEADVRSILYHELSHIFHWDQLTGIVQRLMTGLLWWNPLVYGLSQNFTRAREEISDTHVLLENDSEEYAEFLINLAENASCVRRLPVVIAMASPHIPLKDRVQIILSKERTMETRLKKSAVWVIALVAILLVGGIAGTRLTFASLEEAVGHETLTAAPAVLPDMPAVQDKDVKQPKLIRRVDPAYPDEAKKSNIEGTVAVEAVIDKGGDVVEARILRSAHELLDRAALEAAEKWKYEPMEIDGQPVRAAMTVVFRFNLREDKPVITSRNAEADKQDQKAPVRAIGDIKPPKLIKLVEPSYPPEAKEKGIEGVVIVEATTDVYGRVKEARVLRSIPALDQAAVDAVEQWVYEPMVVDGEARESIFTVTCRFRLDEQDHIR